MCDALGRKHCAKYLLKHLERKANFFLDVPLFEGSSFLDVPLKEGSSFLDVPLFEGSSFLDVLHAISH